MLRWIQDSLKFLCVLGLLQLARLCMLLFCAVEVVAVFLLWVIAFIWCQRHDRAVYLLMPVGATFGVAIQVALWQFTWLRLAQRGGRWRALAECFTEVVRYPIVRTPHPWE